MTVSRDHLPCHRIAAPRLPGRAEQNWQRLFICAALLCTSLYFISFAAPGLSADFSPDDLMNLHNARKKTLAGLIADNIRFYSSALRPLGGFVYSALFEFFGFNPFPMRGLCFVLAFSNVGLLFFVSRRLSGSYEVAVFTILLGSFHGNSLGFYYDSGNCYDLLSFFFYYSALLYYISIRERGREPGVKASISILSLFVCALNSKEISVTLPLIMGLYEILYQPLPRRSWIDYRRWIWRNGRLVFIGGIMAVGYALGKTFGSDSLTDVVGYKPNISLMAYLLSFGQYLNELFYRVDWFTAERTGLFLTGLAGIAVLARRTYLRFACVLILVGVMPVAFLPRRGLYSVYVPMVGLWIFGGGLLSIFRGWVSRKLGGSRWAILGVQTGVFLIVLAFLLRTHVHFGGRDVSWMRSEQRRIRHVLNELDRLDLKLPPGGRVLFVHDPFEDRSWGRWSSFFILRLYYDDHSIEVERCSIPPDAWVPQPVKYAAVLNFEGGRIIRLSGCEGRACCSGPG